ncbi:MAG: hypothetical protein IPM57_08215 [Oligoflexia bacterium]|nr:hypothetical protein [Oligoflexia bacterium]
MTASFIDKFLHFLFANQLLLIEVLFAVIIGLCIMWLFFNLQTEAKQTDSEKQLKEIERALEKVIINTSSKPTLATQLGAQPQTTAAQPAATPGAPPVAATGQPQAVNSAELEKLKTENVQKTQKLGELEKALIVAKEELTKVQAQATPAVNTDEFQKKIKELEARLAEYEIIEDDIANLSLYKEENARLKNELQKIKTEAPKAETAATPSQASEPKPAQPPAQKQASQAQAPVAPTEPAKTPINSDKLVEEVASIAATPAPVPKASATSDKDTGEKLIEEFEGFMKDANKT